MNTLGEIDSAKVALLFGLSVGLSLAVHAGFFVVAAVIAAGAIRAILSNLASRHHSYEHRH